MGGKAVQSPSGQGMNYLLFELRQIGRNILHICIIQSSKYGRVAQFPFFDFLHSRDETSGVLAGEIQPVGVVADSTSLCLGYAFYSVALSLGSLRQH